MSDGNHGSTVGILCSACQVHMEAMVQGGWPAEQTLLMIIQHAVK